MPTAMLALSALPDGISRRIPSVSGTSLWWSESTIAWTIGFAVPLYATLVFFSLIKPMMGRLKPDPVSDAASDWKEYSVPIDSLSRTLGKAGGVVVALLVLPAVCAVTGYGAALVVQTAGLKPSAIPQFVAWLNAAVLPVGTPVALQWMAAVAVFPLAIAVLGFLRAIFASPTHAIDLVLTAVEAVVLLPVRFPKWLYYKVTGKAPPRSASDTAAMHDTAIRARAASGSSWSTKRPAA